MAEDLYSGLYTPDVLSCLANLSSDEVFTPPTIANQMLDLLPQDLFNSPDTKFLDPACKTGVFLREIAKRLLKGLEAQFPDLQERIDHIFQHQIYGVAITELTSLLSRRGVYCSKYPNSIYSVTQFEEAEGNIRFKKIVHHWKFGRCVFCGASQSQYDRDEVLETHAYELIHTSKPEEIFKMKFDVIVGNPPYQLSDGGGTGKSARPLYHKFVDQAKKLNPRYLSMIIPARWYSGGKGLDEFRETMLSDKRIRKLVDFENSDDVFHGVDISGGICYFLWSRDEEGLCEITTNFEGQKVISTRALNEYNTLIRHEKAIQIVKKIKTQNQKYLSDIVSVRQPFGISSTYLPHNQGIPCWFTQKQGKLYADIKDVRDKNELLNKWKLLIPKAPIAGQTDFSKPVGFFYDGNVRIVEPGTCCSESWLVACAFDTESEVKAFKSYLFTKTARFLLLQTVVSQNISKKNFNFVPDLGRYSGEYTDEDLIELWGITKEEWEFIDAKISTINKGKNGE